MPPLSSEAIRALLESTYPGIAVHHGGRLAECNAAFAELFGYAPEEIEETRITDIIPAESVSESDTLTADDNGPYETVGIHRNGSSVSLEAVSVNSLHEGLPARITAVRDIRRRRRFEKSLRHAQKMEAIGQLAAGIAHEINNPLTYIVLHLETLLEDTRAFDGNNALTEEMTERLEEALEGAERVSRLVKDINVFARVDEDDAGTADLEAVVETSRKMAANVMKSRARLVTELGGTPPVRASQSRLTQVILNLFINAAHAIEEGHERDNEIRVRTWSDGRDVTIEVSDTGKGVPDNLRTRIFDPFFTTKPAGLGTGMGLSICRSIIESFSGTIELGDKRERGTAFLIRLPVAASPVAPKAHESPSAEAAARRMRMLVMDDESGIGDAIRRVLGSDHEIVSFLDAREGLRLIRNGERFDLILCDLMMPDFTGMDFHEALMKFQPEVAAGIVFMTGGETTPKTAEFLRSIPNKRLSKPFRSQVLRDLARERSRL
ncbi:MAG: ATP-binding protein [Candidatus Hydrogenedentota bacterium]